MEQVGRYRILGELGRGAMGIVYRAMDPAIGRTVAIKTIRLDEMADASERVKLRDRLLREAQSAGVLSHAGIVTIYDVGEEGDIAYIAMECVDGTTLDRLMSAEPLPGPLALSILSQTAAALDYAHARGVIHRDIKPANIMVHDSALAKITDFGVAKIQSHQMTQSGSMIGTPNYMSPEQIQGQTVNGRSDQFSLAVIAYELLTGVKPFSADSIPSLAFKIVKEDPEPAGRLNPSLDWPVDVVLKRGLAKDAGSRYDNCVAFVAALSNACRACRDWAPIARGAVHDAVTVAGAPAPPVAEPAVIVESIQPETQFEPEPPAALRWARKAAVAVFSLAAVVAAVIGIVRLLEDSPEPEPGQAPRTVFESPPVSDKPSPMPMPQTPPPPSPLAENAPQPPPNETSTPPTALRKPVAGLTEAQFITSPPGAFLVVDGSSTLSCTSPCSLALAAGRHTVSATIGGFRRALRIIEIPRDAQIFLSLDKSSGTVMVRSEPKGAAIFINGEVRPEKTPALLTLPTGRYQIELERDGQRIRQDVLVADSGIANMSVSFNEQ